MSDADREQAGEIDEVIRRCRKLAGQLLADKITFDEYANSITLAIIAAGNVAVQPCVELVPSRYLSQYTVFLQAYLEPVDFMPNPTPFIAGSYSQEIAEQIQKRLRPRYQRLYQAVKNATAGRSSVPD